MRNARANRDVALDGLCFYVDDAVRSRVFVDGRLVRSLERNAPDHTGRPSISIPWPRLKAPA